MTEEEREEVKRRILVIAAEIYGEGYAEGMARVMRQYALDEFGPEAGKQMSAALGERLELVEAALSRYEGLIERKHQDLVDRGLPQNIIQAELHRYAAGLADDRAQAIAAAEFGQAKLDGAKALMDASGNEYLWRFPHLDLNPDEKGECAICRAIRLGSPYTTAAAEARGFPSLPHPGCDHAWVIVPKGELSRTEAHPPR